MTASDTCEIFLIILYSNTVQKRTLRGAYVLTDSEYLFFFGLRQIGVRTRRANISVGRCLAELSECEVEWLYRAKFSGLFVSHVARRLQSYTLAGGGVGLLVTNAEGKTLVTALNPYYISSMHEMNCQS